MEGVLESLWRIPKYQQIAAKGTWKGKEARSNSPYRPPKYALQHQEQDVSAPSRTIDEPPSADLDRPRWAG